MSDQKSSYHLIPESKCFRVFLEDLVTKWQEIFPVIREEYCKELAEIEAKTQFSEQDLISAEDFAELSEAHKDAKPLHGHVTLKSNAALHSDGSIATIEADTEHDAAGAASKAAQADAEAQHNAEALERAKAYEDKMLRAKMAREAAQAMEDAKVLETVKAQEEAKEAQEAADKEKAGDTSHLDVVLTDNVATSSQLGASAQMSEALNSDIASNSILEHALKNIEEARAEATVAADGSLVSPNDPDEEYYTDTQHLADLARLENQYTEKFLSQALYYPDGIHEFAICDDNLNCIQFENNYAEINLRTRTNLKARVLHHLMYYAKAHLPETMHFSVDQPIAATKVRDAGVYVHCEKIKQDSPALKSTDLDLLFVPIDKIAAFKEFSTRFERGPLRALTVTPPSNINCYNVFCYIKNPAILEFINDPTVSSEQRELHCNNLEDAALELVEQILGRSIFHQVRYHFELISDREVFDEMVYEAAPLRFFHKEVEQDTPPYRYVDNYFVNPQGERQHGATLDILTDTTAILLEGQDLQELIIKELSFNYEVSFSTLLRKGIHYTTKPESFHSIDENDFHLGCYQANVRRDVKEGFCRQFLLLNEFYGNFIPPIENGKIAFPDVHDQLAATTFNENGFMVESTYFPWMMLKIFTFGVNAGGIMMRRDEIEKQGKDPKDVVANIEKLVADKYGDYACVLGYAYGTQYVYVDIMLWDTMWLLDKDENGSTCPLIREDKALDGITTFFHTFFQDSPIVKIHEA